MKQPTGKRQPPKREQSPVIAGRVPASLHKQIKKAAQKSGRTMSDEMAFQVATAFNWETTRLEMQRMTSTVEGVEELMRAHGFQWVPLDEEKVVWAPPGMDISRMSISLDAAAVVKAMEPELAGLLARTINKLKPGGQK